MNLSPAEPHISLCLRGREPQISQLGGRVACRVYCRPRSPIALIGEVGKRAYAIQRRLSINPKGTRGPVIGIVKIRVRGSSGVIGQTLERA